MTETVILAIITGVVTILTAIIGKLTFDVGRTKKDAKAAAADAKAAAADSKEARIQVKNSHDTNLREEGDERHAEIVETLKTVIRDMQGIREDNLSIKHDIGILHGSVRGLGRDITGLRETDSQARSDLAAAVTERNEQLEKVRLDIPALIRQECQRKEH